MAEEHRALVLPKLRDISLQRYLCLCWHCLCTAPARRCPGSYADRWREKQTWMLKCRAGKEVHIGVSHMAPQWLNQGRKEEARELGGIRERHLSFRETRQQAPHRQNRKIPVVEGVGLRADKEEGSKEDSSCLPTAAST